LTAPLAFLHGLGARALLVFAVLLAIWGTYSYFRKAEVTAGFRSSYLIMAGLAAFALGGRPTTLLHLVYGVFAVLFLPGAYLYAHGGSRRREAVVLAGATWVVSIAYFRGIATG
jgi:hypothetical protein